MNIDEIKCEKKVRTQFTMKQKTRDDLMRVSKELGVSRFIIVEKLIENFVENFDKEKGGF